MYQEEQVYESFPQHRPEPQTYVDRLRVWAEDKLTQFWDLVLAAVIPILQIFAFLGIVVVLSVIFNVYLRRVMVPRALIHERVYFDYVAESPNAKIRLDSAMNQWSYVKSTPQITSGSQRRFLKADSFYDIHAVFTIAKSARNYDIGASALTLKTVDATGDLVAKSVRALIVPYQHPMSLLLESLAYFPWRAVGTLHTAETVDVWVDLMRGYHEPSYAQAPTETLELHLNSPVMDMSHAYITVMPKLTGVVYYMYYYAWSTFLVGCTIVSAVQVFVYSIIGVVILALRYFLQTLSSPDPLAQQYAGRRRAGLHASFGGASASRSADGNGGGAGYGLGVGRGDRSQTSAGLSSISSDRSGFDTRYSSSTSAAGNRYRTYSANSTGSAGGRGSLREFVSTHLSSAAADEVEEEVEDDLIDTINADLLSSRDRNRTTSGSSSNTDGRNVTNNSHLYMNTTLTNSTRGLSVNGRNNNNNNRSGLSNPSDWDLNYHTPHRAAPDAPHSAGSGSPGSSSSGGARSVSVGSARGVRGGVRDLHGTATPSSTTSSGVHSERSENDSESADPDDLETVFRNDFFNRFFPFLSRKGSTFDSEDTNSKKNR